MTAPTAPTTIDSDEVFTVEAGGTTFELVCGLEVHAELATATKMFSGAPNRFGDEPNTNVDPVTLGLPGTLPVVNERAIELAIRFGLAVGAEIRPSVFARKNYFYPDMPKDFQISQYDLPIVVGGSALYMRAILDHFEFATQITRLQKAGLLYRVLGKFAEIDLHPDREGIPVFVVRDRDQDALVPLAIGYSQDGVFSPPGVEPPSDSGDGFAS